MRHIGVTLDPALYCDHGRWQVTQDETCLYLPQIGRYGNPRYIDGELGYWLCRWWCWRHGYGWLPVI
jgi:hypothetical protein